MRTIEKARRKVLKLCDDEHGERHAPTAPSTGVQDWGDVDAALRDALDGCLEKYLKVGGHRFDEVLELSSSATDGSVDLGAYGLADVRAVRVLPTSDGLQYPIEAADPTIGGAPDTEARDLSIIVVRRFTLSEVPDEDDLLLGQVEGVARSWDAFEKWVIAVAADDLGATDNESRASILRQMTVGQKEVCAHASIPRVLPWYGSRRRAQQLLADRLKWVWYPHTQRLNLLFTSRGG